MSEPFNAGDRKSIRAAEKIAAVLTANEREAVVAIMSTKAGRAWMERKLSDAHIFHEDFTGNALREAFLKGQRNFGLALLADIHRFCPEAYLTMMRERNERDTRDLNAIAHAIPDADGELPGSPDPDGGDSGRQQPATDYDIYRPEG